MWERFVRWCNKKGRMDSTKKLISNKRVIVAIYVLFALAASIQSLTSGTKTYDNGGIEYNRYNNYTIFEKSFQHLKSDQDLYILYPQEQWDLYKYTPTFSVFFGFFSMLPDGLGLSLWNLLNALVLLAAVYYLPKINNTQKGWILLIVLIELMTSMQNAQSNGLIAGLIIFSFGFLEKDKPLFATLFLVFAAYIKLFGIVGFVLFLFYPKKWQSALFTILWIVVLLIPPLLYVDIEQYINLFGSYLHLLISDHDASYGYSVMGWLHSWFSINVAKNTIVAIGVLVFLLPLYRIKLYKEFMFKYLMLTSVLIWIVIFNHKAESPTFILAMSGVALWFVSSEKNVLNIILFIGAFLLTSLSPTDIFPVSLREDYLIPYVLKAFPCILIWLKIVFDMLKLKNIQIAIN